MVQVEFVGVPLVLTLLAEVLKPLPAGGLIPRQQILLKRPDLAKVLTLTVDPKSYWIYTNTPIDNERVATVLQEYGFDAGLDRLSVSA